VIEDNKMKVFLHTRSKGMFDWRNELRDFARIPVLGEYLAWDDSSPWYQVQLVVHTPFEQADCDAEVYAVEVDHNEVKRQAFQDAR
jgi:hypothetical protein